MNFSTLFSNETETVPWMTERILYYEGERGRGGGVGLQASAGVANLQGAWRYLQNHYFMHFFS